MARIWDPRKNINKQRFGKLVAYKRKYRKGYSWWWECVCDCGRIVVCDVNDLLNRKITACALCSSLRRIKRKERAERREEKKLQKSIKPKRIPQERKNASGERRLVLLAIENISSTKTARAQGLGASTKLIQEYTKLPKAAIDTSIAWLKSKGIIYAPGGKGWLVKEAPREDFCFKHGYVELIGGRCLKCINESGR